MEDKEEIKNTETEEQESIDRKTTDDTNPVKEVAKKTTVKRKSRSRKKQP